MIETLRIITNDAAGKAIPEPTSKCVALRVLGQSLQYIRGDEDVLTDIAPNRSYVGSVIVPYERVYSSYEGPEGSPDGERTSADVP